ncbi:hypothetical protein AKJ41_01960 [candidate division MSBL1 archaeon SCGC-AAA259O05]|uniref:DUF2231 domain-containing protein n=1 Tax=candidate division MSBL1 archaeon SCGC-AAA259O05 TaxID=1698271 RepID=A0A133V4F0_9EURY|nr:hypothetical protein AKJ41_01960 [candidate division MSBL1 archaeon SCGC-AAA259O05]
MELERIGWIMKGVGFLWVLIATCSGFSAVGWELVTGSIPEKIGSAHAHLATCSIIIVAIGLAMAYGANRFDIGKHETAAKTSAVLSPLGVMVHFIAEYIWGATGINLGPIAIIGMILFFIGIIFGIRVCLAGRSALREELGIE